MEKIVAYVLINTEPFIEKDILKEIQKIEGVSKAHMIYGPFDIIARIEADNLDKVNEIVTEYIRKKDNVRSTSTMTVVGGFVKNLETGKIKDLK